MNKIISFFIAIAFLAAANGLIGQDAGGTAMETAMSQYPILQNKLKKSDKDLVDPKQSISPKFWLNRADLMLDIYEVNLKYLVVGAAPVLVKMNFGEPKQITTEAKPDGNTYEIHQHDQVKITYLSQAVVSWEEFNKIYEKPLPEAYKCLEKSQELDVEHKLDKKIKEAYLRLSNSLISEGSSRYLDKDYKEAFNDFKLSVDIKLKPVVNTIDTLIMFYTGLAASKVDLVDESIKYYEMALSYNLPEPTLYVQLKQQYFIKEDTNKGIEILKKGFDKFPESQEIVVELINHYMSIEKSDEALNYIKIAQQKDPTNISLIFAEGTLYDKKGEVDKAEEIYKKTIEMDPNYFNGYYNLSVMYINTGQELFKKADASKSNDDYKKYKEEGDIQFGKAREPMEHCVQLLEAQGSSISAEDKTTLKLVYQTLNSIYTRLSMFDKANEMKEKLSKM